MKPATEKILVVGPSWVGDMVMSQSLYIYLQNTRPGVSIDVLAPAWSEPILARMPQVASAIGLPLAHGELGLGKRRKLGHSLRAKSYDQAILLPNSLKSALIPWFAGIPLRTGWKGEMRYGLLNDVRKLDEVRWPLMVQRFVALGQPAEDALPSEIAAPALVVDAAQARACAARFDIDTARPILALCPGAEFGAAKRWPETYYADLAQEYLAQGWQVVLYGSAKDTPVTAAITAGIGEHPDCKDLAGRTQLAEVVDLLSLSRAVVSNDSGLMHIAAALGCAVVVVYGPTSDRFTPPLSERAARLVSDIECAPCFKRECPLGHHRCMREILPNQVSVQLQQLLASTGNKLL